MDRSIVWRLRLVWDEENIGSNPIGPIVFASAIRKIHRTTPVMVTGRNLGLRIQRSRIRDQGIMAQVAGLTQSQCWFIGLRWPILRLLVASGTHHFHKKMKHI